MAENSNFLLPERKTDIRGAARSREELLAVSSYQDQPERFAELLRVLDHDLRLITPTEQSETGETVSLCSVGVINRKS